MANAIRYLGYNVLPGRSAARGEKHSKHQQRPHQIQCLNGKRVQLQLELRQPSVAADPVVDKHKGAPPKLRDDEVEDRSQGGARDTPWVVAPGGAAN